jgi:hypothetical protein
MLTRFWCLGAISPQRAGGHTSATRSRLEQVRDVGCENAVIRYKEMREEFAVLCCKASTKKRISTTVSGSYLPAIWR